MAFLHRIQGFNFKVLTVRGAPSFSSASRYQLSTTAALLDASVERQQRHAEMLEASKLSLAPMMEYTDRHFRHLVRLISSKTLLYTEMVAANALSHERRAREEEYIQQNPNATPEQVQSNYGDNYLRRYLAQGQVQPLEGPSALQLGGSSPEQMVEAAETILDMTNRGWCNYTAINLNCGCPSPKVAGKGCFGAALMDDPQLVADLTQALHEGSRGTLPVTVKCRIGTDSQESFSKTSYAKIDPEHEYERLCQFIETVASNGIVTDFSVHARIAVLSRSYSPTDNRKIPPLKYDVVRRLVQDFPEYTFSLNGGVESIAQAKAELDACPNLAGVMIGRSWAADPWSFATADQQFYNEPSIPKNRLELLEAYGHHADREEALGDPAKIRRFIVKAVTTLFTGEPNSKRFRVALDGIARLPKQLRAKGKTLEGQPPLSELILNAASEHLSDEVLSRSPEEGYERALFAERKRQERKLAGQRSEAVVEWQSLRDNMQQG